MKNTTPNPMQKAITQMLNGAHNWRWSTLQKLNTVNNFVNDNITWVRDKSDYWQAPQQTIERGAGDCEDIAILKAHLLRKMGLTPRLGYCKFRYQPRRAAHIVCICDGYVLDVEKINPMVIPQSQRDDLLIQFTFNHHSAWVGGQVYKMAKIKFSKYKDMLARSAA